MQLEPMVGERGLDLLSHSWLLFSQQPWVSGCAASQVAKIKLLSILVAVIPSTVIPRYLLASELVKLAFCQEKMFQHSELARDSYLLELVSHDAAAQKKMLHHSFTHGSQTHREFRMN